MKALSTDEGMNCDFKMNRLLMKETDEYWRTSPPRGELLHETKKFFGKVFRKNGF